MRLRQELAYPVPPQRVRAMLADADFRRAVCEAQECLTAEVSCDGTAEHPQIVVDQVHDTTGLPPFARALTGRTTRSIQRENWTDDANATVEVEAVGTPTSMNGSIALQAEGEGTLQVVSMDVSVEIPLIGDKLAKLMVARVAHALEVEHRVGTAWLAGDR